MEKIMKGETASHDGILINPKEFKLLKIGKQLVKHHLESKDFAYGKGVETHGTPM